MRQQARTLLIAAFILAAAGCTGRTLPDACYQPPESGSCRASLERYFHDSASATCKPFLWGGCNGTVPFETRLACEQACIRDNHSQGPDHD